MKFIAIVISRQIPKAIYIGNTFGYYLVNLNEWRYFMAVKAIAQAIHVLGSQQKLADACNVKQPSVCAWLHGRKKVSAENAKRIEKATDGAVPAYKIRPDLIDLFPHPNEAA